MSGILLGNLAVPSFTTTILFGFMCGYLLALKGKPRETLYLLGYLLSLFLLLFSYTVRYSLFSPAGALTGQVSNLIVFGVACLVRFAYLYGGDVYPKEGRIASAGFLLAGAAAWASLFFRRDLPFVYDFKAEYFTREMGPRISYVTFLGYLWAAAVLARKASFFARRGEAGTAPVKTPGGRRKRGGRARSCGSFAVLTLATAAIAFLYLLFQTGVISRAAYSLVFNSGSAVVCLLIFIVYLNDGPQPSSFRVKLIGIPLAVVMVASGLLSGVMVPRYIAALSERYRSEAVLAAAAAGEGAAGGGAAYVMSAGPDPGVFFRLAPDVDPDTAARIFGTPAAEGLLRGDGGPRFLHVDVRDTSTFFFQYELAGGFDNGARRVLAGFRYGDYRRAVHGFASALAAGALAVTLFVVFGFPLIYRQNLFGPLRRLLDGVRQVETGNYREILPVESGDELGMLARGYNRMAEALRGAEGSFKALAENANDAILIRAKSGRIVYANARAAELTGYAAAELRRLTMRDLFTAGDFPGPAAESPPDWREGAARCRETAVIARGGRRLPVEVSAAATSWHGRKSEVLIVRDMTERKQAEEKLRAQEMRLLQADKLASLGAAAAETAHEIGNPNQVVALNARLLEDGLRQLFTLAETSPELDDGLRIGGMPFGEFRKAAESAVEEISGSARRIGRIVGELRASVRGGPEAKRAPTDVNDVVGTVAKLSRHIIGRSTDRFGLDLAKDLPLVEADGMQLEQVVLNLLRNACQSLPDRGREVSIHTSRGDEAGTVRIRVVDRGKGISPENLERITGAFFTTRREEGGTGLGLSIARRIVKNHGGTLRITSRPGEGTTAEVILPAAGAR